MRGRFRDHHALLVGLCLEHTAHLEAAVATLDERVDALFAANESEAGVPFTRARDHLDTITGMGKRAVHLRRRAVGHSILVICWHLLNDDADYDDLGGDYFTRL